jgi:hypothetical protein
MTMLFVIWIVARNAMYAALQANVVWAVGQSVIAPHTWFEVWSWLAALHCIINFRLLIHAREFRFLLPVDVGLFAIALWQGFFGGSLLTLILGAIGWLTRTWTGFEPDWLLLWLGTNSVVAILRRGSLVRKGQQAWEAGPLTGFGQGAPADAGQQQTTTANSSHSAKKSPGPAPMTMTPPPVEIIDPSIPGPFDRCLCCFEPATGATYCPNCGRHSGWLDVRDKKLNGKSCAYHPERPAQAFCVICGEPICASCEVRRGFSSLSLIETPQCRRCLDTIARLERNFAERLGRNQVCAKHPSQPAQLSCAGCGLPHCDCCLYYVLKGIFRTKVAQGPYCLPCFRLKTDSPSKTPWISAYVARNRQMI